MLTYVNCEMQCGGWAASAVGAQADIARRAPLALPDRLHQGEPPARSGGIEGDERETEGGMEAEARVKEGGREGEE